MNMPAAITQEKFRRIMARNIGIPLGVGALSAVVFIGLIVYLLSALRWVEHTERVLGKANEVARLASDMEAGVRGYLISGELSFLHPYDLARSRLGAGMGSLQELVKDSPAQLDRLRHISALQLQWQEFANTTIDMRGRHLDIQEKILSGAGKNLTDEMRRQFSNFIEFEQQLLQARNTQARNTTLWSVLAYLLFTLGINGLLALWGRRELIQLSHDYDAALKIRTDSAQLLEQVAWLRTGQTRLAERIIEQQTAQALGSSVLNFVAPYLDAPVAALYMRQDDGRLSRVAGYGLENTASQAPEQSFGSQESLVGQAASENRLLQLDDLPDNYLAVNSGLGRCAPRHVLLVPLHNEGRANGVVELGFLRALLPRDREFVGLIGETIGAAIEATRSRQRLQQVLAQSQELNEELQVQQEELRSANEELEEQSRVLGLSQATLENQQAELEQTNLQLAEQALSLDHKNSALQAAQTQLEARAQELSRASRYKSEFLANMSHELRTPLNSSLILARLLAENPQGNLSAEQVRFAESIHAAGNDLLALINDILDISKVEAGRLELTPEDVPLASLADALKSTFEPLARQKNLALEVRLAPGVPATVHTDRQRVEQILKNLLSNAIKFTDTGKVSLTVSPLPGGGIALAVQDSGIGIRQDQQALIFEAFRQADGTTSRRYGGTGLGLSISRDLSALLGGSISVQSAPGQGSTFTLVLPASLSDQPASPAEDGSPPIAALLPTAAHAPPAPAQPAVPALPAFADDRDAPRSSRLLLIVEDDPGFARILYDLAHERGFACLVAHGAEDGVALAAQFSPDAVLLDMVLPDRSGLSVLQRLKENAATRHIPVHVISGQDRREAALHMGAVGYAIKPASREQLGEVFARLEAKLAQKLKRVLLVEDDALQRQSVSRLIEGPDVDITAVETGAQALALLADTVFDCMIVDLKLPDMQGSELLRRMSQSDICSFPPVIVYTGRSLTRAEEADLLKYSRSIIIKGARSPERLLDEVTLFLHKVEASLPAEQQSLLKTARSRDRVFEGRKVLLVDDDVRNLFALTSALEQKGLQVETSRNGFEALAKLDTVSDIDLVLMDVMMPGMDGLEATRLIRQNPDFQKLPVIAVTAKAMKDDQEQCLKAGANDYLAKPLDLDRLFSLLRVWLPALERL